ncbi:pyridoxal phosphate-dependent aminotransferase [Amycolatopsis jejuensis]|uniref:pyridoxal phosphate-dependent aminotransferase n=1 Tax=Amycolatopsis jejuensis TaxID=330084 RepID=UPI00069251EE|nr:pyridoxal phosphate-dependent aminotransferase [Amycolatopsis jejuensis]
MTSVRHLMDPVYAARKSSGFLDLGAAGGTGDVTMMCWADPFRPDDVTPDFVKEAAVASLRGGGAHYTLPIGDRVLRDEVAAKFARVNGIRVDPERNVTISGGSDALLLFGIRPFLTPGARNEVLTPVPSYVCNFESELAGGATVGVPTFPEDGYDLRIEEFEKRLTPRTKIVLITNPNNPTATVYRRQTLERLADFVRRNDLVLVVDQSFEDTVFDGHEMVTPAALPGMFERTITICSLSKGMGLCGYRVGYLVASDDITDVLHSCAVEYLGAPNTAAQTAAVAALRNPGFVEDYRQEYMARADAICALLDTVPNLPYTRPQAGFYVWLDVSAYGGSAAAARYLLDEAMVAPTEGDRFGSGDHLRLVYATHAERQHCLDATERLVQALRRHAAATGRS